MKYILILTDGLADWPIEELNNKTIMESANVKNIDTLSKESLIGLVKTVPDGYSPGSDTANLSIMGYDPIKYYTGRSPIEAESIGVNLDSNDITFRTNFVTIDYNKSYDNSVIIDHGAGEIPTEDAQILLNAIKKEFENDNYKFYCGTSYRHLLVLKNANKNSKFNLTPPHNILSKKISSYLPKGEKQKFLIDMMIRSYDVLNEHPINKKRVAKGLNPANSIWFWGPGKKLNIPSFKAKNNLNGAVISGVDLIKGIGKAAKMKVPIVDGANGTFHTNYIGKAQKAVDLLTNDNIDFVYLHIEAPDESGHKGDYLEKKQSYEKIDKLVLNEILKSSNILEPYRILILPDHPTPIELRTHTNELVPFLLYDSEKKHIGVTKFCEKSAKNSGLFIEKGYELLDLLFSK